MKKLLGWMSVVMTLALGTNVLAQRSSGVAFTPGDIVVLRVGDGTQCLTNLGNSAFLDEYTITNTSGGYTDPTGNGNWAATWKQTIPLPTNWFGGSAPLIMDGTALADGELSLSTDGRFLVIYGYGATLGNDTNTCPSTNTYYQVSKSLENVSATNQVPRVIGLVDGFGHVYTTTTLTNTPGDPEDPRTAVSIDGTNIWLGGAFGGISYAQRGSMTCTQVQSGNIRVLGITSTSLYYVTSSGLDGATNTAAGVNPFGGSLPTSSVKTNFVILPGVDNTSSPFGFAMFTENGGPKPDTLYVADPDLIYTQSAQGVVLKYTLLPGNTQWVQNGSISCDGAWMLTGQLSYSGTNPVVTLFVTDGGTATPFNLSHIAPYIDASGFNGDPGNNSDGGDATAYAGEISPLYPTNVPNGDARINLRGVAFVPQGGESSLTNGPARISCGPPYGIYCVGSAGGPFYATNVYSIANFGTDNLTVNLSGFPTFLTGTFTPGGSSGTVTPLGSITATVVVNSGANSLSSSTNGTFIFSATSGSGAGRVNSGFTNTFTIGVNALVFAPQSNFEASAELNGIPTPESMIYVLSNVTPGSIAWSAGVSNNPPWVTTSPNSGTLSGNQGVNITVSFNNGVVAGLAAGVYSGTFLVSNVTANLQFLYEYVDLQIGFGFFDDFSTYIQNTDLVGQGNWNGNAGDTSHPQVSGNAVVIPYGCPGTSAQEPWKNIASANVTDATQFVYAGMLISVTQGSPYVPQASWNNQTVSYELGMDDDVDESSDGFVDDRVNIMDDNGNGQYLWLCHISGIDAWEGSNAMSFAYGTTNMVIIVANVANSNVWVVVNPPDGTNVDISSYIANASSTPDYGYPPPIDGTVAAQDPIQNAQFAAAGAGADPTVGTFYIGPYCSPNSGNESGFIITKLAVSTNWPSVYGFLKGSVVTPPADTFTATPTSGATPLTVSFTDIPSNSPTSWFWTFGDGNTSTAQNPSDTYLNPGSYTAQLIASNAGGASTPVTQTISVYDPFAWWRLKYFGSTNGASGGPGVDVYGTGMSNTNKFMAGFSGTNSAAFLHIISVAKTNNNADVKVIYLGANGNSGYPQGPASRTNVLEYTSGTANGSYTNNFLPTGQTNILSGGSGLGTVTNMTDAGGGTNIPSRYYRVRVLLP